MIKWLQDILGITRLKEDYYQLGLATQKKGNELHAENLSLKAELDKKEYKLREDIGQAFFMSEHQHQATSNIIDELEYGYGPCDDNGFFAFPIDEDDVRWKREMDKRDKEYEEGT